MKGWSHWLSVGLFLAFLMAGPVMAQSLREVDASIEDPHYRADPGERHGKLTGREASNLKDMHGPVERARGRFQDVAAAHPALDAPVLDAAPTRVVAQTLLPLSFVQGRELLSRQTV